MNIGKDKVDRMVSEDLELVTVSEQLSKNVSQRVAIVRGYVLFGDNSFLADFRRYTETSKTLQKNLIGLRPSPENKKLVELNDQWRAMVENEVFPSYASGNLDKALTHLNTTSEPIARELMAGFDRIAASSLDQIKEEKENLIQDLNRNKNMIIILAIVSVLLGIGIALYLSDSMIKPIRRIVKRIQAIAGGDLRGERIESGTKDEIAGLAVAMNGMVDHLRELVVRILLHADRISLSSGEMSAEADRMSRASEKIAEEMQEVAAGSMRQTESMNDNSMAMSEMSSVIQRIAEATNTATQVSLDATTEALQGNEAIHNAVGQMTTIHNTVGRTSDAMKLLGQRIGEINSILAMLEEVSAQTNLLALNASVEAARAGVAGRGFAVVADEIKKLSVQSASSAKSISDVVKIIQSDTRSVISEMDDSVQAIEQGMKLVGVAGETFNKIVSSSTNVSAEIQEIAASTEQMSASSEQLSAALSELTGIAERSLHKSRTVASTTEDQLGAISGIAASSVSLNRLSDELKAAMDAFKT